jgi:hypothetical protein
MDKTYSSETCYFQQTTRSYTSDDITPHNHCCENLKFYKLWQTLAKIWDAVLLKLRRLHSELSVHDPLSLKETLAISYSRHTGPWSLTRTSLAYEPQLQFPNSDARDEVRHAIRMQRNCSCFSKLIIICNANNGMKRTRNTDTD